MTREMLMLRINRLTVKAKLVSLGPTKNGLVLAFASASNTGFNVWVSTVRIDILMKVTQPCGWVSACAIMKSCSDQEGMVCELFVVLTLYQACPEALYIF